MMRAGIDYGTRMIRMLRDRFAPPVVVVKRPTAKVEGNKIVMEVGDKFTPSAVAQKPKPAAPRRSPRARTPD